MCSIEAEFQREQVGHLGAQESMVLREGIQSEWLKRKGYITTSIDIVKKYNNCIIVDVNKGLPFKDNEFDLIWCDQGSFLDYVYQKNLLLPLLSSRMGSYIIFHSTLSNVHGFAFTSRLKLEIMQGRLPEFEIISFLEPHKVQQNSCTILRRATGISESIYTERP